MFWSLYMRDFLLYNMKYKYSLRLYKCFLKVNRKSIYINRNFNSLESDFHKKLFQNLRITFRPPFLPSKAASSPLVFTFFAHAHLHRHTTSPQNLPAVPQSTVKPTTPSPRPRPRFSYISSGDFNPPSLEVPVSKMRFRQPPRVC